MFENLKRGCSSVGRASGLQPEGHRFEPVQLHQLAEQYGESIDNLPIEVLLEAIYNKNVLKALEDSK